MKKRLFVIISAWIIIPLSGLAQNNLLTNYIPSNTTMVMLFNPVQIANKVPGGVFRQSAMYRQLTKKDDGQVNAFLSDPSMYGIDLSAGLALTSIPDTLSKKGSIIAIFGTIKNEESFAGIINKMNPIENSIITSGNSKIYIPENAGLGIGWNKEVFVLVVANKSAMKNEVLAIVSDSTKNEDFDFDKWMSDYMEKMKIHLHHYCSRLIEPASSSLLSNSFFSDMLKERGDIRVWSDGSGYMNSLSDMPVAFAGIFSKLKALSGNNKISIVNFEKGKIVTSNRNFFSKEIAAEYSKYPSQHLNTSLLQRLPEKNILALFTTSMPVALGNTLLQKSGFNEIVDSLKKNLPFDIDLLRSAFGGDLVVAILDMSGKKEKKKDEDSPKNLFEDLDLIIALPIIDKNKFESLGDMITHFVDSLKDTESGEKLLKGFKPYVKYNDSICVISFSKKTAENFLENKKPEPLPESMVPYVDHPMLIKVDMKEFMNMMLSIVPRRNGAIGENEKKILGIFDQLIVSGGDFANGSKNSRTEIRFSNPDENAFKQLFDLMNYAIEQSEKEKPILKDEEVDIPPPPIEELKQVEIKKEPEKTKNKSKKKDD